MCICGAPSFPRLPTVQLLVPYKNRGGRHGQLSLRKTSISTLVDKEGKGFNKLEAMSFKWYTEKGQDPNKVTWKIYRSWLRISKMRVKCILLVGDPTHPLSTLTFPYCNWTVGRPWNKAGLNTQLLSNPPPRVFTPYSPAWSQG